MTENYRLERPKVCLLIIDVQEKILAVVERPCEVMHAIHRVIKGFQIMDLPIVVSEQYPEGLGSTMIGLKNLLGNEVQYFAKTTFSCFADPEIKKKLTSYDQFVLVGLEAHVCVLQTAKDLMQAGAQVIVLNDAITSRSIYDFSTAIAELRDIGVRVSSVETILFELLHDSKAIDFKQVSQLVKSC